MKNPKGESALEQLQPVHSDHLLHLPLTPLQVHQKFKGVYQGKGHTRPGLRCLRITPWGLPGTGAPRPLAPKPGLVSRRPNSKLGTTIKASVCPARGRGAVRTSRGAGTGAERGVLSRERLGDRGPGPPRPPPSPGRRAGGRAACPRALDHRAHAPRPRRGAGRNCPPILTLCPPAPAPSTCSASRPARPGPPPPAATLHGPRDASAPGLVQVRIAAATHRRELFPSRSSFSRPQPRRRQ